MSLLPVKSDFVFRLIFGDQRNVDILATRSPQMRKAVGVLKELSAGEATRMRYEAREKARRDEDSRVDDVEEKAKVEIAKNALRKGMPIDDVADITGLTHAEVGTISETEVIEQ